MESPRPVSDYIQDLQRWTQEVLSRPSPILGGMAPCPYASPSWEAGLVAVGVCNNLSDVADVVAFFPDSRRDVYICILPDVDRDDLLRYVEETNDVVVGDDIWIMSYHPDDDPEEYGLEYLDTDWDPVVPEDYAMVFIQRLSKLVTASYNLESKGYYDQCPWKTYRDLVHRRNQRAIKHGKFRDDDV